MNNKLGRLTGGLLLALYAGLASAAYQLNFQPPVTRIASEIYDLHMLMMYVILVIFCVVFGVMFYSIYAHRKSVGHKAAQFHENTTVEIIWTVIPFVILIGMAWPGDQDPDRVQGHVQPRHHHQGHRLPVEMGLRLPQGRRRRHCVPVQPGHAAGSDPQPETQGRKLPARSGQPAGGAGGQENAHAHHRQRRDPLLLGAGLRHQAGRHSRFRARHLVQGRQGGHLPRPVRRAVRQGPWLHADRGRGGVAGKIRAVGCRAERRRRPRPPRTRTSSGARPS